MMAMSYGYVYVATVAMGANPAQLLKALLAIANGSRKKRADGPRQNW